MDLPDFCNALQLDRIDLPDWYQEFRLPPMERSPPSSPLTSPDNRSSKKLKASRRGGVLTPAPRRVLPISSLTPSGPWMSSEQEDPYPLCVLASSPKGCSTQFLMLVFLFFAITPLPLNSIDPAWLTLAKASLSVQCLLTGGWGGLGCWGAVYVLFAFM